MTEEAGKEKQVRDSRLEAILNTIVDAIITIDERGTVQTFNPAAEKIFGYPAREVIGRNVNMLMPEPYRSQHDSYLSNYLRTGIPRIIGIGREVVGRRRDGTVFPMELAVSEAQLGEQRIFTGIVRDISERRQAELERERLFTELEVKSAELERFNYTVSHDLRTPLTPIIGYAEFLQETYRDQLDPAALDMLAEIEQQGHRMLALMEDLLVLAKAGHLQRPEAAVDTCAVVAEVLAEFNRPIAEKQIEIDRSPCPPLHVPRTLLSQIFTNLIGNAIRYAGKGENPIEIGGERRPGGLVRLWVRDHGPGIAEEERGRIFNLFYRGSAGEKIAGTGLGLATVRKIARTYGGEAWVEETPGGGATFIVEFTDPLA